MISIILATYNERDTIVHMIETINQWVPDPYEIVIVDDDSPDRTWKIAEEVNDNHVRVIRRHNTGGLASAVLRGIIECRGDIICWWDADMDMCPPIVPKMTGYLKNHDVVIGSRYVDGGGDERTLLRRATSRWLNKFAAFVLGYEINDYDSGFVAFRRSVLDTVMINPHGFGEYFIEFIFDCCRKGLRVMETPYVLKDRQQGSSKSAGSFFRFLSIGFMYGLKILTLGFAVRLLRRR